jgi:hypothetical protein
VAVCIIISMRRPRHGATSHPQLVRPGNGFGRPLRPGPRDRTRLDEAIPSDEEFRRAVEAWLVDVDLVSAERGDA